MGLGGLVARLVLGSAAWWVTRRDHPEPAAPAAPPAVAPGPAPRPLAAPLQSAAPARPCAAM